MLNWLNKIRLKGLPTKTETDVLVVDNNGDIGINGSIGGDITRVNISAGTGLTGTVDTLSGDHTQTLSLSSSSATVTLDDTNEGAISLLGDNVIFTGTDGISTSLSGESIVWGMRDATGVDKGIAKFSINDFSVSSGAVQLIDLDTTHIAASTLVTEAEGISSNDNDTTLPTSAAVKDYTDGRSIRVYGDTIKILPSDFMANEEAGVNPSLQYVDNTSNGLKPGNDAIKLLAFVDIPEGKKATLVDVYMDSNETIEVFEVDIHQSGITSKGSGTANTQLNITDVSSTSTNFLMIRITTVSKTDRVWGGLVTIADI